ncbi:hypothetical protein [Kurthia massiliensis]|uniref:hypothetical protein n=1 Tax=Kurthia massiliensis TaxID=1033739 RepID=UPI000289C3DA|nr:hypothetical protein [Kurthia massiliensis]
MDEKEKYPVNEEFKKKADAEQEKSDYERMSSPDQVDSDTESLFDKDESMKHVDPIPVEELNDQVKDEKPGNREDTKSTSSSERKYPHQDK